MKEELLTKEKILISGAGISGLTLAWWLNKYGYNPVIIESHPSLRSGGYMIDFWGRGYDIAEKMGILDELKEVGNHIPEWTYVDERGNRIGGLNVKKLSEIIDNRLISLLRSDLEKILYSKIKDKIEIRFNTTIKSIVQSDFKVEVLFNNEKKEEFDIIVGADGLHSNTRNLIYGKKKFGEKFLGYYAAVYSMNNFLEDEILFKSHSVPGKQVGAYHIPGKELSALLIWKSDELQYDYKNMDEKKEIIREVFSGIKWITPKLLDSLDLIEDVYFDSVSIVELDKWFDNRVVLIGDAAHCVSFVSGQGSSLGMASAYILAGEINESNGAYIEAFQSFQNQMQPVVKNLHKTAVKFAGGFAPKSKFNIWLRNKMFKLMTLPIFRTFVKKTLTDDLVLKDYL